MPQEEIIAEQMAIHTCSTLIRWLVRDDPMVCRILEEILAEEEERVSEQISTRPEAPREAPEEALEAAVRDVFYGQASLAAAE